jgi:predicted nucleic-acid-binding protein
MIALDTNVVVRFLVQDEPRQSARARALITTAITNSTQLYLSDIVICEVVWVLESAYGFGRGDIATVLKKLINARHLTFRSTERVQQAVDAYAAGKGDFADYLIRADALDAGCDTVVTFDRALHREKDFRTP